jgi:glycosyltransferase involved in cell wall biosynthesis
MRLAICLSHPIQYKSPLFRKLANQPGLDLQVFYYSDRGVIRKKNKYHEVVPAWDVPLLDGYPSEFIPNMVDEEKWNLPYFQPFINPKVIPLLLSGEFNAVMLHSYLYPSDWFAFVTAKIKRIPILFYGEMYPRGDGSFYHRLGRSIINTRMIRGSDACLAIGSIARQVFFEGYHVPADKIFLAPYVVDNNYFIKSVDQYKSHKKEIKRLLGISDDLPIVLCVAAMVPKKRHQDLVQALAQIHLPARLILVGHGPLFNSVRDDCRKLLPDTLLTGFVNQSDLPRYYSIADVFVLPSLWEEFGLVVNEAMCAGLPIITTNTVAASKDLVREGENGFTYTPGNVAHLAENIDRLLQNTEMRYKLGQRSLEIISGWNVERTVAGIMQALNYVQSNKNKHPITT